jgi:hypothetical protein
VQSLSTSTNATLKDVSMRDYTYDHKTLLNGSPVDVEINVSFDTDWDGETLASFELIAVYFDGVDVSPILDKQTLIALEMEAQSAIEDNGSDIPSHLPTL